MKTKTLLLVGHGSSFNRDSSAPVYEHAARIRDQRLFDEVHVAFWKESPWICNALSRIDSDDVHVVPMFMAEGYFTRIVVPRELGTSSFMHLCRPVGTHSCMADLVLKRAASVGAEQHETVLVVIGHGTDRSTTSSDTVCRVTGELRERCEFQSVECGFLDQEPRIESVVSAIDARNVVLVPFLMAEGYHTRETIPKALSLDGERTERDGRVLWYTQAVGTMPEMAWAAVNLTQSCERTHESAATHANNARPPTTSEIRISVVLPPRCIRPGWHAVAARCPCAHARMRTVADDGLWLPK
jgi:sirohydrochlorin cobaltochelatase